MLHADYELPVMTVAAAGGAELRLVRRYSDGIVVRDSVALIVYDANGIMVARTPLYRDVLVRRAANGTVYASGIDFFGGSHQTWALKGTALQLVDGGTTPGHVLAVIETLRSQWLGSGLSVLLCTGGLASYLAEVRATGHWSASPGLCGMSALLWIVLNRLYGPLSTRLIVNMAFVAYLPFFHDLSEVLLIFTGFTAAGKLIRLSVFLLIAATFPGEVPGRMRGQATN